MGYVAKGWGHYATVEDVSHYPHRPREYRCKFDPAAIYALKRRGEAVATLITAEQPLMTVGEMIAHIDADFLLQATPTNLRDGQPGRDLVRAALDRGMHAMLASKGPLVLAYQELTARDTRSTLAFSGAVCGAMPTVNVGRRDFAGGIIERVEAIFNGTTQVILGLMAAGQCYEAALAEAQRIGIVEPDPALDVEGWDAANKLVIFANAVLRQPTTLAESTLRGSPASLQPRYRQQARRVNASRSSREPNDNLTGVMISPLVPQPCRIPIRWHSSTSMRWTSSITPISTGGSRSPARIKARLE